MFQTIWKILYSLESFWRVWKVSGESGKFPDRLESFQPVWKVSIQSGKLPDSLESFLTVWRVSGHSGIIPDSLEHFWTVWTFSGQFGKFLSSLGSFLFSVKSFRTVWKIPTMCAIVEMACMQNRFMHFLHIYVAKAVYALLAHFCRENDLLGDTGLWSYMVVDHLRTS